MSRLSARTQASHASTTWSRSSTRRSSGADGQSDRLRLLQTIGEYARERLEDASEADVIALRHAQRYAALAREIRDDLEGSDQVGALERGIAEESNLQAALDTLLAWREAGRPTAPKRACGCAATYRCTGTSAARTSAREYAMAFLADPAALAPSGERARC